MKKAKMIIYIVVALCIVAAIISGRRSNRPDNLPQYIMHAGGALADGRTGTNSAEAMNQSYESGHRWMEIDFIWTSDEHLVCVHDWGSRYSHNLTGVPAPDSALFEELRKSTYGYESHTLDSLVRWMRNHPDAIVVTDVKENNLKAAEIISQYDDIQNRFVMQIYHPDEYETIAELGFDKIILTFYKMSPQQIYDDEVLKWLSAKNEKLIACTLPVDELYSEIVKEVKKTGIPIYVHTVNEPEEQKKWLASGICGIYCDTVS